MKEDEEVLEFRASAGDLLRVESQKVSQQQHYSTVLCHSEALGSHEASIQGSPERFWPVRLRARLSLCFILQLVAREFDITQTLQLKNNLEMPLGFRLGTQPPFSVLNPQPQPRARTGNSSNPSTGDSQSLLLPPQRSLQVRQGEAVGFWQMDIQ